MRRFLVKLRWGYRQPSHSSRKTARYGPYLVLAENPVLAAEEALKVIVQAYSHEDLLRAPAGSRVWVDELEDSESPGLKRCAKVDGVLVYDVGDDGLPTISEHSSEANE